ncbi:hypothetical protein RHSIM_Rhsim11G0031500 [Rhododendron simsii]|uniref:Protein kinase domain-containing protein n=1 Tax=Rhododendron simsii TaxID=118357 RepID=A0A834G6G2_RHOSS|nr:hypothetical protein RHSIM_Rhsim11G0031500 [Rhododendron simsii]
MVLTVGYLIFSSVNATEMSTIEGGAIAAAIIVIVAVLIIIGFISCACARILTRATVAELQHNVATIPQTSNVVQDWEIDAPTTEMFLQDLAKEKPVRFTAQQLCSFTNNYSKVLGSGGFGVVYKGQLQNGVKIAVKVLKRSLLDKRAEEQFMAEVSTIGRTFHINLVRLYGFSYDRFMRALVYEYMENGSLDKYLFGDDTQGIDWNKLPEIAIGTAKGYKGTPGYSAPEFLMNNYPITNKCDVYSFGMLLFEIVGRRRNAKGGSGDSLDWFPKHVWDEYEKGDLATMTFSYGIEEKHRERAQKMAMVALWCVQDSPEARPPMSDVIKMLEGRVEIMPPPKPFTYMFPVEVNLLNPAAYIDNSSNYSTSYGTNSSSHGTNSSRYKEHTTAVMAKYDIQIVSSSQEMG